MEKILFTTVIILSVIFATSAYSETPDGQPGQQGQQNQSEKERVEKEKKDKEVKEKTEKEKLEKEKKNKEEKEKQEKEKREQEEKERQEKEKKEKESKKEEPKKTEDKIIIKKTKIGGNTGSVNNKKESEKRNKKEVKEKVYIEYEEEEMEPESDGGLRPLSEEFNGISSGGGSSYGGNSYGSFNLDLRYNLTFSAKYSLLGTYFSSYMESNYFTGQWPGDMLFTGNGGELSFTVLGFIDKNIGLTLSVGYFEHRNVTQSFSDALYAAVENSELKLVVMKLEVIDYLRDWFYIKGGVASYSYTINTNVTTNMPGYTYTGLEGSTKDSALTAGAGLQLELFKGFTVNLGADLSVFIYDKTMVKGLRAGFTPYFGISILW